MELTQVAFKWCESGLAQGSWQNPHVEGITRHHCAEIVMLYGPPSGMKPIKGRVHPSVTRVNWKCKTWSHHPELRFFGSCALHCEIPAACRLCPPYKWGRRWQCVKSDEHFLWKISISSATGKSSMAKTTWKRNIFTSLSMITQVS